MNDVLLNKKVSIERCVSQIKKYYAARDKKDFDHDFITQDAIAINLQRACEQSIDMANYVIKKKKLGLPQNSKESFTLLQNNKIIPDIIAQNMKKMVGFRNILVHEYQQLNLNIMIDVIENHLDEIVEYTDMVVNVAA